MFVNEFLNNHLKRYANTINKNVVGVQTIDILSIVLIKFYLLHTVLFQISLVFPCIPCII